MGSETGARKSKNIFWMILLLTGGTFIADICVQQWKITRLHKNAEAGNSDAMYILGQMDGDGWNISKNGVNAVYWYLAVLPVEAKITFSSLDWHTKWKRCYEKLY